MKHNRHIGLVDAIGRPTRAIEFHRIIDLRSPPQTGCIHELQVAILPSQAQLSRVSGRAGLVV